MSVETTGVEASIPPVPVLRFATIALGALIALAGIAWGADLYRLVGWTFLTEQFLAAVLGMSLALVFVTRPLRLSDPRPKRLTWYDSVLALVSLGAGIYAAFEYPTILSDFFGQPTDGLIVSWLFFLLVIEGLRRTAGWSLVIVGQTNFSMCSMIRSVPVKWLTYGQDSGLYIVSVRSRISTTCLPFLASRRSPNGRPRTHMLVCTPVRMTFLMPRDSRMFHVSSPWSVM